VQAATTVGQATAQVASTVSQVTVSGAQTISSEAKKLSDNAGSVVVSVGDSIDSLRNMTRYLDWAAEILEGCISAEAGTDVAIPSHLIAQSKGIVFLSEYKAGFLVTLKGGFGAMMAHLPDGRWSGPCALGVGGLAGGFQAGLSSVHSILLLNTEEALQHFSGNTHVRLGAGISIAAGPVGRSLEGHIAVSATVPVAVYCYSFSKGLFAGAALGGAVVSVRHDANAEFYGREVSAAAILNGQTPAPRELAAPPLQGKATGLARLLQTLDVLDDKCAPQCSTGVRSTPIFDSKMVSLDGLLQRAVATLLKCQGGERGAEMGIPLHVLENAKGIVFTTIYKAGFLVGLQAGRGFLLVRLPDGQWSGPCVVGVGGISAGFQAGLNLTEAVLVLHFTHNFLLTPKTQPGAQLARGSRGLSQ
jgi:lipid-binding SYLF domain-containing protein